MVKVRFDLGKHDSISFAFYDLFCAVTIMAPKGLLSHECKPNFGALSETTYFVFFLGRTVT